MDFISISLNRQLSISHYVQVGIIFDSDSSSHYHFASHKSRSVLIPRISPCFTFSSHYNLPIVMLYLKVGLVRVQSVAPFISSPNEIFWAIIALFVHKTDGSLLREAQTIEQVNKSNMVESTSNILSRNSCQLPSECTIAVE